MQISFVMLLFSDQISGRGKLPQGGGCPPVEESQADKRPNLLMWMFSNEMNLLMWIFSNEMLELHMKYREKLLQQCGNH